MSKKATAPDTAYGTRLRFKGLKSNHSVKSRYMAAALAMVFGVIGANQFYLKNFGKGFLKILLTVICVILDVLFTPPFILIPFVLSIIAGVIYLLQTDASFARANHVRTI